MEPERIKRLSRRLLSQLEDFYVHEPSQEEIEPSEWKREQRDLKVIKSEKTRKKLEKWFQERKIPIRIIYGRIKDFGKGTGKENWRPVISPIGKSGVITYYYSWPGGPVSEGSTQDPPTAWMIVHNILHAIDDLQTHNPESPYERDRAEESARGDETIYEGQIKHNIMGEDLESQGYYPTTRAYQQNKLTDPGEGYPEIFAQWVVTGKVILDPRNLEVEKDLEQRFRTYIDYLAKKGSVIYNV